MGALATRTTGALAVVAIAFLTGCGDDGPQGRDDTAGYPSTGPLTLDDATIDAATDAALDIRADGCGPRIGFGTGSMIDDDLAVTAAHVVAGATAIEVIDTSGRESPADVVYFDPDLDIAVIRTAASVGTPIELRPTEAQADERGVIALPRSAGGELDIDIADVTVTRAVNISTTDIYLDADVDRAGFEVDTTIDPGDSGGLVVLPGGGAGIVWARSRQNEGRAWAIDLPPEILDPTIRATWTTPVDNGPCIR